MLTFPIIQAVLRLNAKQIGGFLVAITAAYAIGEWWAASRYEDLTLEIGTLAQQMGVLLVVGVAAANYRHLSSIASTIFKNNLVTERQRERRRSPGDGFAVVYVDVAVEGDLPSGVVSEVLREVIGKRINACIRVEDQVLTSDADAFAVLLEGLHELMDATVVAERILKRLDGPVAVSGASVDIDTRVGVAYSPNHVVDPDDLIEAAGREVSANSAGRSSVFFIGFDLPSKNAPTPKINCFERFSGLLPAAGEYFNLVCRFPFGFYRFQLIL